jgi:glyoxylase-like metal-dependent hydrolase (beta-lactamase superfamily II)
MNEALVKTPLTRSRPGSLDIKPASQERDTRATRINEFVFMSQGSSNSYLVATGDGNVLVNTGLGTEAPVHKRCFDQVSNAPLRYILITQGHVDHVGGIDLFKAAHPGAIVVAQQSIHACQEDDDRLKTYRYRRNVRFFPEFLHSSASRRARESLTEWAGENPGNESGLGPKQSVARPDVTFADEYRFELGGRRFEMFSVPGGETIDSALVWLPEHRILFSGNTLGPLFPHMPNLYTIRGDRLRFALPYLAAVERMIDLGPELLVTGHFEPIAGAELIRSELVRLRDAVAYVHDKTVEGMNAGKDVFTLMKEVRLPDHLEVGEDYGTVAWAVRAIYEGYGGWFQFRSTTEIYEVAPHEVYADLATLAGEDALVARAADKLVTGKALEAIHLVEIVLAREPAHRGALELYVAAHERLLADSHARNRWQKYWLEGEIAKARARLEKL